MEMGTPFEEDHPDLRMLYSEAKAAQWTLDELPWRELEVPDSAGSAASAAAVMCALSEAMLRVTSRGVNATAQTAFPLVLSVETRDYARHLEFWRRILEQFGPTASLPAEWDAVRGILALNADGDGVVTSMLCGIQPALRALYTCARDSATQTFWRESYALLYADLDRHIRIVTAAIALQPEVATDDIQAAFTAARELFAVLAMPDVGELEGFSAPFHDAVSVISSFMLHLS